MIKQEATKPGGDKSHFNRQLEIPFGDECVLVPIIDIAIDRVILQTKDSYLVLMEALERWWEINNRLTEANYKLYIDSRADLSISVINDEFPSINMNSVTNSESQIQSNKKFDNQQTKNPLKSPQENPNFDKDSEQQQKGYKKLKLDWEKLPEIDGTEKLIKNLEEESRKLLNNFENSNFETIQNFEKNLSKSFDEVVFKQDFLRSTNTSEHQHQNMNYFRSNHNLNGFQTDFFSEYNKLRNPNNNPTTNRTSTIGLFSDFNNNIFGQNKTASPTVLTTDITNMNKKNIEYHCQNCNNKNMVFEATKGGLTGACGIKKFQYECSNCNKKKDVSFEEETLEFTNNSTEIEVITCSNTNNNSGSQTNNGNPTLTW